MVSHPSRHDPPLANRLSKHPSHVHAGPSHSRRSATSPVRTQRSAHSSSGPTLREKLRCFREREPVMCPPSPPTPEITLLTEEEYYRRSQERIDAMTQRLAGLPLYQARCMINLACTQLKGPFEAGGRYWGKAIPVSIGPTDIVRNNGTPVPELPHPGPRRDAPPNVSNPPLVPFPFPPPAPAPVLPATFQGARAVNVELAPAKLSVGRPTRPENEIPHPAQSPTPSPPLPRAASQGPRASQAQRTPHPPMIPPESTTPVHSPGTPRAQPSQAATQPPTRPQGPGARRPSMMSPPGPQIFPRHSTPARGPGYVGEDSPSREPSPLLRFSQREPTHILKSSPGRQPRFSPSKILSQTEDEFESLIDVDRQLQGIADFMEEDIAN